VDWGEDTHGAASQEDPRRNHPAIKIEKPGTPEYEHSVNTMADRITQSYVASAQDRKTSIQGERFYDHDAFGAAHAIANGIDPDSQHGRLYRRPPVGAKGNPIENVARFSPEQLPAIHRAAGVIARLSPQNPWEKNVHQAWEAHQIDPDGPAMQNVRSQIAGKSARQRVTNEHGEALGLNSQPSENIAKAVDIAHGRVPVEKHVVSEGSRRVKIGSFYNNIIDPDSHDTTVDFRHHDIAYGKLLDTGDAARNKLGSTGRYRMVEDATTRATNRINSEHSDLRVRKEPLTEKEVQAVSWWGDKHDTDRRFAERPEARQLAPGSNLYMVPNESGTGSRKLGRGDLGKPLGQ
jgi:urease beta subunit